MPPEFQYWTALKARLLQSEFRSRFRLRRKELQILAENGMENIQNHCRSILVQRLAPAYPKNDGKQTPMKGHPCFVAQHATGICCRTCLQKWHGIPPGRPLTESELDLLTNVLICWIREHSANAESVDYTPDLFTISK